MSKWEHEISRAGPADLDDLERLERECFAPWIAFSRRQLRYLLASPSCGIYVLRHGGRVVADAIVTRRQFSGGLAGRIYSLAVEPGQRSKGFGRALLAMCMDLLRGEGAASVSLEVGVENDPAIRLYESVGFRKVGRLADYYAPGRHAWKMRAAFAGDP